jgi:hypothetical protein
VSFNARVNAILEKYVKFFMQAKQDRVAIIHPTTHQFFLNEIDEAKYTAELKRLATETEMAFIVLPSPAPPPFLFLVFL